MQKRQYYILLISAFIFLIFNANADFIYKDFDTSMYPPKGFVKGTHYKLLKRIYDDRNPTKIHCKTSGPIPKTIHQIWLGPKAIPAEYLENSKKWKSLHPNWEYKLWREQDIANWNFASKDLFNKASSYQEKSDILRYEILNKHGGLYVDMDYKPLRNFDDIHSCYTFYGSIEPLLSRNQNLTIANSIIASAPNNLIFLDTLVHIRKHWKHMENLFRIEAKKLKKEKNLIHLAVNRTMMPFNKAVLEHINNIDNAILFPTSYMSIEERESTLATIQRSIGIVPHKLYQRTPKTETMAVQKRGHRLITNLTDIKIKDPWYKRVLNALVS